MILGLGSDICDIRRIEKVIEQYGDRFLERVYTETERSKAMRRTEKIRAAILAVQKFAGAEGEYNFDQYGDGLHGYNIVINNKDVIEFQKHIEFTD